MNAIRISLVVRIAAILIFGTASVALAGAALTSSPTGSHRTADGTTQVTPAPTPTASLDDTPWG